MMSTRKSVRLKVKMLIPPSGPAGTMVPLARTRLAGELMEETFGWLPPEGQAVR